MALISCPSCTKEMFDMAPACPHCGRPHANVSASGIGETKSRSVGVLLGVGIFFLPWLFAWLTLRKGHTVLARALSFVWLFVYCFGSTGYVSDGYGRHADSTSQASNSAPAVNTQASTPATNAAEPVYEVPIKALLNDYKNNEVAADNKYKGKRIQTTGVVTGISKDFSNSLYVSIGTGDEFEIPTVQAFFDDSMNDKLSNLRKGQKLTIQCEIDGLSMNVMAKDCVFN